MNNALKKALLELGRVVTLSIIPILITSLQEGVLDLRLIVVVGAIAGLRFIDKLLHEYGKETNNEVLIKSLTQF